MKYSIFIHPKSENSSANYHAINFVKSVLNKNHQITSVFFYGLAVKYAFFYDSEWEKIAKQHVSLIACSTIAESYQLKDSQVVCYFRLHGLGQWMESMLDSDKRIEFI
ncbi:MAG: DsrE family protein [Alcanivoracaceae bacterium]|nr:DsrE family protein [Alcanivoracaceae bacterium]